MDITGVTRLYLNVRDANDGIAWDHADWLNPTLSNGPTTKSLAELPWQSATAGWGQATVNKSVSGAPLIVGGKTEAQGIGTHANSLIEYALPAGYTRFRATVGLDQAGAAQNTGGTLQFLVFTQSPLRPAQADSVQMPVALAQLGLQGPCTVRDLWTGQLTTAVGKLAPYVRRHGARLYRISKGGK